MDFSLNDEQKMMIDTVRRFIAEELKPLEDSIEEHGFLAKEKAQAIHEKARKLGLYAMNMPAELGGGGRSNLDRILCDVLDQMEFAPRLAAQVGIMPATHFTARER
jgi:acyl-CoA dehydrogenase